MSTPIKSSKTAATQQTDTPPGQKPMGATSIALVAIYLVLMSVLVLYGLLKVWPPTPSGESRADSQAVVAAAPGASPATTSGPASNTRTTSRDPETIYFIGGRIQVSVYAETRLLLIVMLAGGLGSLLHSLRSLYWYTGNREMVWSWVAFYTLLPLCGAILSVIFYFVVRGGFFSPQASFEFTSPFGFAALSSLVGLFSAQATLKLKDVAETIFTKPGAGADAKTQETLTTSEVQEPEPIVSAVKPSSGSIVGAEKVTIEGTGFDSNSTVLIGNLPAPVISATSTTIEATTPPSASGAGVVDIEISNPNGKKATLPQSYTYVADGTADNNNN